MEAEVGLELEDQILSETLGQALNLSMRLKR